MVEFQAFKSDGGEYRWRLVENGRAIEIRPGRIRVPAYTGRKRKSVEGALDRFLAGIAHGGQGRSAKA